jgi:hypothetical protein
METVTELQNQSWIADLHPAAQVTLIVAVAAIAIVFTLSLLTDFFNRR